MSKREEFIDKTDRRKIPKLSYSIEYICDRIVDWYYHVETTKIAKLSIHDNKINYMYEPLFHTDYIVVKFVILFWYLVKEERFKKEHIKIY